MFFFSSLELPGANLGCSVASAKISQPWRRELSQSVALRPVHAAMSRSRFPNFRSDDSPAHILIARAIGSDRFEKIVATGGIDYPAEDFLELLAGFPDTTFP